MAAMPMAGASVAASMSIGSRRRCSAIARALSAADASDDAAIAANFEAARSAGRARWRRAASRFDRRHAPDYALIDIGTARSYGIIPLGAHGEGRARAGPAAAAGLSRKSSTQ